MKWYPFFLTMAGLAVMMLIMIGTNQEWKVKEKIVLEEYYAENLKIRVFYNKDRTDNWADVGDYDLSGEIKLTVFVQAAPKSEIEEKASGCWLDMGPAIVRMIANTKQVVSVTYIKE